MLTKSCIYIEQGIYISPVHITKRLCCYRTHQEYAQVYAEVERHSLLHLHLHLSLEDALLLLLLASHPLP
jgi:hypothetical protein